MVHQGCDTEGEPCCSVTLGVCYQQGIGVAKDEQEAAKWFRGAAELGHAAAIKALQSSGLK